jgi:hypothetical protein
MHKPSPGYPFLSGVVFQPQNKIQHL